MSDDVRLTSGYRCYRISWDMLGNSLLGVSSPWPLVLC